MTKKLVRLWERPSKDGKSFTYCLVYYGLDGRRKRKSLGHQDRRKAEREAVKLESILRAGCVEYGSMNLHELLDDYLEETMKVRYFGSERNLLQYVP